MPTTLSMLDCLNVYRAFIGTRCSIRCVAIRTIYADNVEHARLFKSISSVQRYSLHRSMRMWPLVKKTHHHLDYTAPIPPQFHQGSAPRVCAGSASGKASEGPSGRSDGSCARQSWVGSTFDPFSTGFDSARKVDGSRRSSKAAAVEAALDH